MNANNDQNKNNTKNNSNAEAKASVNGKDNRIFPGAGNGPVIVDGTSECSARGTKCGRASEQAVCERGTAKGEGANGNLDDRS